MSSLSSLHAAGGRQNERGKEGQRWEDEEVGARRRGGRDTRRKWEQKTKKEKVKEEDEADWECQGKGQLPLQHFSLINRGERWPG